MLVKEAMTQGIRIAEPGEKVPHAAKKNANTENWRSSRNRE